MTFTYWWSWKIIHPWSKWSSMLIQTIMPSKKHRLTITLSPEKPIIPFLYLQPVSDRELLLSQFSLFEEIVKSQQQSRRVTIANIFIHEAWTTTKDLSFYSSILLSRNPPTLMHGIQPTFNNFEGQFMIFSNCDLTMKTIIPQETPRKSFAGWTKT